MVELNSHIRKLLNATDTVRLADDFDDVKDQLFIDCLWKACSPDKDSVALLQQGALEMWLVAGTDTSSLTAYYSLLGLAGEPDLQQELREELVSSKSEGASKKNWLLDSIINETLQFKPVCPVVLQEAVNADPNFPGISIEKGAAVLVHLAEMNLHEEYWQDPESFNGRRFMDGGTMNGKTKTFFPF